MIYIYGTLWFGNIYVYQDTYVAVRCNHIWWLPIVPRRAYLLLSRSGKRPVGVPLSWKSPYARHALITAYSRAFFRSACFLSISFAMAQFLFPTRLHLTPNDQILLGMIGLACLGLLRWTQTWFPGNQAKLVQIEASARMYINSLT